MNSYGTLRHTAWEAHDNVGNQEVIYHNLRSSPNTFHTFVNYWPLRKPSLTGHSGNRASIMFVDESSNKSVRYTTFDGSTWLNLQGTWLANNAADPSLSITNPPGGSAQGIWRSGTASPYTIAFGPSTPLSKPAGNQFIAYRRRVIYHDQNGNAALAVEISTATIKTKDGSVLSWDFAAASDTGFVPTNQLANFISLPALAFPANVDSVIFEAAVYSNDAGILRSNGQKTLPVGFTLTSATTGTSLLSLPVAAIPNNGAFNMQVRAASAVQNLAGANVKFLPALTNLDLVKASGAVVHVYDLDPASTPPSKSSPAVVSESGNGQTLGLRIHPNPFLRGTKSRFA
jgi:hypothetical protein